MNKGFYPYSIIITRFIPNKTLKLDYIFQLFQDVYYTLIDYLVLFYNGVRKTPTKIYSKTRRFQGVNPEDNKTKISLIKQRKDRESVLNGSMGINMQTNDKQKRGIQFPTQTQTKQVVIYLSMFLKLYINHESFRNDLLTYFPIGCWPSL